MKNKNKTCVWGRADRLKGSLVGGQLEGHVDTHSVLGYASAKSHVLVNSPDTTGSHADVHGHVNTQGHPNVHGLCHILRPRHSPWAVVPHERPVWPPGII